MPGFTNPIAFTYTGLVEQETRKFTMARGRVLREVFAADDWSSIVRANGDDTGPVNVPIDPDWILPDLVGHPVAITLPGDRGITLVGGWYKPPSTGGKRLTVILLTGSGGSPSYYGKALIAGYLGPALRRYVKSVLLVDYRGFGCSRHPSQRQLDGSNVDAYVPHADYMPGSKGFYTDTLAMIAFLEAQGVARSEIVLHGYSLGSGPAVDAAQRFPDLAGLVLHSPIASVYDEAKRESVIFTKTISASVAHGNVGFENDKKIASVRCPMLLTCGDAPDDKWYATEALARKARVGGASSGRVVVTRHPGEHFDTGAPFQSDANGHDSGEKLKAFVAALHTRQQLNIRS
jgi:pimeloyl-ACP methyl ester carboxylesterase